MNTPNKSFAFGQKLGYQVDKKTSNQIDKSLKQYQINTPKNIQRYYKIFQVSDHDLIKRFKHLVCINLDLSPVILYLTKIDDHTRAFYIDRQKKITEVHYRLDESLYNETILEGEFFEETFLISDLLVEHGKSAQNHSLTFKLSFLQSLISNRYTSDPVIDTYTLKLKPYVELEQIKDFYGQSKNLYQNRFKGLILRPNSKSQKNLILNHDQITDQLLSLWQPTTIRHKKHKTTLDITQPCKFFVVAYRDKPDVYVLYLKQSNGLERYEIATVTSLENSLKLQKIFKQHPPIEIDNLSGYYFNCQYVERFKRWEPINLITY